jgi:hypothetical protein
MAIIPGDPQPAPPTGLGGTVSKNMVPLFWTAPIQQAGVTVNGYGVFRCANAGCPKPPLIATVTATKYTDKPGNGVHFYEVKANDTVNKKAVTSAPSNIIKVVVQ